MNTGGGGGGRPLATSSSSASTSSSSTTGTTGSNSSSVPPHAPSSVSDVNDRPRDALVMDQLLRSMGVTRYEPKVINQLLEFMHRKGKPHHDSAK